MFKFLNHHNFILSLSLILGFLLGDYTEYIASISVWFLALVMIFSTSGFAFSEWKPWKQTAEIIVQSFLLNYVLFGILLIGVGFMLFSNELMITGIILLAVSPPGPSVVPFSAVMKGDVRYAVTGVFWLHLLAIAITPIALFFLLGESAISPMSVVVIMLKVVVGPLIISRLLRHPKLLPTVEKIRGNVINWGFFLVVMPIVGLSKGLIMQSPDLVLLNSLLFFVLMFGGGFLFNFVASKLGAKQNRIIAANLMFTTKSSAFAAVASFSLLPRETALPAAIHAVFVTVYFIVYESLLRKTKPLNQQNNPALRTKPL